MPIVFFYSLMNLLPPTIATVQNIITMFNILFSFAKFPRQKLFPPVRAQEEQQESQNPPVNIITMDNVVALRCGVVRTRGDEEIGP